MDSRRASLAQQRFETLDHPAAVSAPLSPGQQIDVQMRRESIVWLGTEIIRMMVGVVRLLRTRPATGVTRGIREPAAQIGTPFSIVTLVEAARVERGKRISADALVIFEDQAQFRLEGEIRAHENPAERVGILGVQVFRVAAVIAGLQTHIIGAGFVAGPGQADRAIGWHGDGARSYRERA